MGDQQTSQMDGEVRFRERLPSASNSIRHSWHGSKRQPHRSQKSSQQNSPSAGTPVNINQHSHLSYHQTPPQTPTNIVYSPVFPSTAPTTPKPYVHGDYRSSPTVVGPETRPSGTVEATKSYSPLINEYNLKSSGSNNNNDNNNYHNNNEKSDNSNSKDNRVRRRLSAQVPPLILPPSSPALSTSPTPPPPPASEPPVVNSFSKNKTRRSQYDEDDEENMQYNINANAYPRLPSTTKINNNYNRSTSTTTSTTTTTTTTSTSTAAKASAVSSPPSAAAAAAAAATMNITKNPADIYAAPSSPFENSYGAPYRTQTSQSNNNNNYKNNNWNAPSLNFSNPSTPVSVDDFGRDFGTIGRSAQSQKDTGTSHARTPASTKAKSKKYNMSKAYELLNTIEARAVHSVAFSPGGGLIAAGSEDGIIRLFHPANLQPQLSCRGHRGAVWSVCFSPGGSLLASGGEDRSVRMWDTRTGAQSQMLMGHRAPVKNVLFSSSAIMLGSVSYDGALRIWSVKTGDLLELFQLPSQESLSSWSITPTDSLLSAGTLNGLIVWWRITPEAALMDNLLAMGQLEREEAKKMLAERKAVQALKMSKSRARRTKFEFFNQQASQEDKADSNAATAEVGQHPPFMIEQAHSEAVSCVTFSRDNTRMVSTSIDGTAVLWDINEFMQNGESEIAITALMQIQPQGLNPVWSAVFSANSRVLVFAVGSGDIEVRLGGTADLLLTFKAHDGDVNSCAFSPDGLKLATGGTDGFLKTWKILPIEQILELHDQNERQKVRDEEIRTKSRAEKKELRESRRRREREMKEAEEYLQQLQQPDRASARDLIDILFDSLNQPQNQLGDSLLAGRLRTVEHLARLKAEEVKKEQHALNALQKALNRQEKQVSKQTKMFLEDKAERMTKLKNGYAPNHGHTPFDNQFIRETEARLHYLNNRLGRRPRGNERTYMELAEMHPWDIARQAQLEGFLIV